MIENEGWDLGAARADVVRWAGSTMVHVRGIVTAPAYEALHLRLSRERSAQQVFVMLDCPEAILATTNQSAVDAALRGAGSKRPTAQLVLLVPALRLQWAQQHCALMSEHGISCSAAVLKGSASGRPSHPRQAAAAA